MERLKDQRNATDPVVAEAARLVGAVDPYPRSSSRERRVRAALMASVSQRPRRLRPLVVLALTLAFMGVAGATVGRSWFETEREEPVVSKKQTPPSTPIPSTAEVPSEDRSLTLPEKEPASPRVELRRLRIRTKSIQKPTEPDPTLPEKPVDEETLVVVTAVRALRRDHDPVKAGALLDDYLARYPSGILVEEALALAIEAAVARKDERAVELGARYLERFPAGKFAEKARKAKMRSRD